MLGPGLRGWGRRVLKWAVFFEGGGGGTGRAFEIAQYGPYYVTVLYTQNGRRLPSLSLLNKRHPAVETPSYVPRSSVNCMGWIAAEKKPKKTGKQ